MWGRLRPHTPVRAQLIVAPAHRGRGESCTLRILTDAFTGALEEKREKTPRRGERPKGTSQGVVGLWEYGLLEGHAFARRPQNLCGLNCSRPSGR